MIRCHLCDSVPEDWVFYLISQLCCLLGLHALVKQAAQLKRLTCKEWRETSSQHPASTGPSALQPMRHRSCQQVAELQRESFLSRTFRWDLSPGSLPDSALERLQSRRPREAVLRLLTHRNCEVINVCLREPRSFRAAWCIAIKSSYKYHPKQGNFLSLLHISIKRTEMTEIEQFPGNRTWLECSLHCLSPFILLARWEVHSI